MQRLSPKIKFGKHKREADWKKRQPKVNENVKMALFMKGPRSSNDTKSLLKELYLMKKPDSLSFSRKFTFRAFEDDTMMEKCSFRYDASLIMIASHTKRNPSSITLVRMFDHHVYDMIELGVRDYVPMKDFPVEKLELGAKPVFYFGGNEFESEERYKKLKNLLLDFYHGEVVTEFNLGLLEYVISVTSTPEGGHFCVYKIFLKKSGTSIPKVVLEEQGPRFSFSIGRHHFAPHELETQACRVPHQIKAANRKEKNVTFTPLGEKMGTVRKEMQDFGRISDRVRPMKALRKEKKGDLALGATASEWGSGVNSPAPKKARMDKRRPSRESGPSDGAFVPSSEML
ncbi:ribosome production factor 2 [Pelomyxa schiedti]|nr:ribosome production factor 2 [Pelomyxa schiedti]